MKRLNKKGVSLAELLAVVVIMGIIAAIAIPLVGNVIETSKKKAFLGDLVTVSEAARTYCMVEGKDTEGFCNKSAASDGVAIVTTGSGVGAAATTNAEGKKLQPYLSKKLETIGNTINIKRSGDKYLVSVYSFEGKYNTGSKDTYVSVDLIDPTTDAALSSIKKSTIKDTRK